MLLVVFSESNIQLVPDGTLVLHLVVIVVMVVLLNATLLRPITRILDERERRTRGRSTEAQAVLGSVAQRLKEYEQRMREARTGGYALLEQQRATGSREREQKVAEVKTEVSSWLDAQKEKLSRDAEQIKGSLVKDARTRAFQISRQILGREIADDRPAEDEQA